MNFFNLFRNKPEKRAVDIQVDTDTNSVPFALTYYQNYANYSSMSLSAVFAAVEIISNSLASLPIHIKDLNGNIIDHPLNKIFYNSLLTKFTLIKQLVQDMLINGNGIAYIERRNGQPYSLIYCPKSTYTINYDPNTRKLTYSIPSISSKPILPKDVIHILKNSINGVEGKGLIYYASRMLSTANAAENQANGYFESGCGINGILKSSKHLSKKQQQDIQSAWNMAHTGTNASNLAVLPVDLDYIALGNSAADSQLLETRLFTVQEVARFFSISPVLLQDLSHSSYSTLEASQLEFLVHTLQPYIELIQDEFNRKLCPEKNVVIDLDELHMLKADKAATASYLSTLVGGGILSINEARHYLGYEDIENGDKHIIPYTNINNNTIENNDTNSIEESDDK